MPNTLPVIDWPECLRLSGRQDSLAKDMLSHLHQAFPATLQTLHTYHQNNDSETLLRETHRLHGALCYVGLPRIKKLVAALETDLKNNIMDSSHFLLDQLEVEVHLFAAAMDAELPKLKQPDCLNNQQTEKR